MEADKFVPDEAEVITPNKIVWYLLSVLTTVLLIAAAAWGSAIDTRQTALELNQSVMSQRLASIEGKLDILLQREQLETHQDNK